MNLICIDSNILDIFSNALDLTIGKVYDVDKVNLDMSYCWVTDDSGVIHLVNRNYFLTIEEYRNSRLDLIITDKIN